MIVRIPVSSVTVQDILQYSRLPAMKWRHSHKNGNGGVYIWCRIHQMGRGRISVMAIGGVDLHLFFLEVFIYYDEMEEV